MNAVDRNVVQIDFNFYFWVVFLLYKFNGGIGRGHTGSHADGVLRNRLGQGVAHRLPQRSRPQDLDVGSVPEDVHHKLGVVL
ncbi:MAG: hypothetical protein RL580_618 [Pseudomonadota bacterium]